VHLAFLSIIFISFARFPFLFGFRDVSYLTYPRATPSTASFPHILIDRAARMDLALRSAALPPVLQRPSAPRSGSVSNRGWQQLRLLLQGALQRLSWDPSASSNSLPEGVSRATPTTTATEAETRTTKDGGIKLDVYTIHPPSRSIHLHQEQKHPVSLLLNLPPLHLRRRLRP